MIAIYQLKKWGKNVVNNLTKIQQQFRSKLNYVLATFQNELKAVHCSTAKIVYLMMTS
jgi:hypothetical protein